MKKITSGNYFLRRKVLQRYRSAPLETKDVENPLNDETLTDNADGNDVPSSDI